MQKILWISVVLIASLGMAIALFSSNFPADQQAAIGSMITAIVVCAGAIAYAVTAIRRS